MTILPFFIFICFTCFLQFSISVDYLTPNQSIREGETLVSPGHRFELGFFSPANSKNRYLGIWYKKTPQVVVWVANRDSPLTDSNGFLLIKSNGALLLKNQTNKLIWSSDSSSAAKNPVAQLLETGNFVVRENSSINSQNYFWQSFDYPTDTRLPGMEIGKKLDSDIDRYLSSWKNIDDPSTGKYIYRVVNRGLPEIVAVNDEGTKIHRSGIWNGVRFSGLGTFTRNTFEPALNFHNDTFMTINDQYNSAVISRFVLSTTGSVDRYVFTDKSNEWTLRSTYPDEPCDNYGHCGANGFCSSNRSPICGCLKGFKPKLGQEWEALVWSSGCVRKAPLGCDKGEGFLKIVNVKLPDLLEFKLNKSMSIKECKMECLKDCSCSAYAKADIRGKGNGCLIWYGDLIDIREFNDEYVQQEMYIRLPSSELESIEAPKQKRKRLVIILVVSTICGVLASGLICWYWMNRKKKRAVENDDMDLPLFDLATITNATNSFSEENVIGEGGFGPVYKGALPTGEKIAVKRLSMNSLQGTEEFKNEVLLIAKLQHRNLVKLLGCCVHGEERMLIYEFMPNKSLDYLIFDENRRALLDWQKRYEVAIGISRGLLYLHQDSRLRIIHRDLKTSNVLLDSDLNPKISDFGLARILGGDQIEAKTKRVIGTYGYMSPEYAFDGKFSVKSDVFSLGVLLLEIVSGKSNRGFQRHDHHHNLLGHAWLLWQENKALDLVDEYLRGSVDMSQALRCIQVGLLCVQKHPRDRPEMLSVVFMLGNEGSLVPQPKEPGFFSERSSIGLDLVSREEELYTYGAVTITIPQAR